ncbi:hypothetical protein ASD21_12605 [Caulobacter sp. Root1455]|uniref:c-type cytochrome n=1 Tax=Caulobacter sp. Root1455 TaxID=1736465 RepID=UPI0006F1E660|nr:cytochrome c [Caulobacter sp. Root1455]KQY92261.1 hypothetical protein ASD21_12605 [Caulobacter sp. Root1455]
MAYRNIVIRIGAGLALAVQCAALAQAAPATARMGDAAVRGQAIVQRDCAGCHAVGRTGDSPNPQAPRFRQLHERYDTDQLGEALAEGLSVGHGPMPEWSFGPEDNAAILAYLKSLAPVAVAAPRKEP